MKLFIFCFVFHEELFYYSSEVFCSPNEGKLFSKPFHYESIYNVFQRKHNRAIFWRFNLKWRAEIGIFVLTRIVRDVLSLIVDINFKMLLILRAHCSTDRNR